MKVEDQYVDVLQNIEFGVVITYKAKNVAKVELEAKAVEVIEKFPTVLSRLRESLSKYFNALISK